MTKGVGLLTAILCFFFTAVSPSFALDTKAKQLAAMETTLLELESHYGMAEFKENTFGVTISFLRSKYGNLIKNAQTLEEAAGFRPALKRSILSADEFRQLMIGMVGELSDGHANTSKLVHDAWGVGINPAMIDGKLYVAGFNKDLLVRNAGNREPKVGDEIIEINGQTVESLAKEGLLYSQYATYETRWLDATEGLLLVSGATQRPQREGDDVTITLKREDKTYKLHLSWINLHEFVKARSRYPDHFNLDRTKAGQEEIPMPFGFTGVVSSPFRQGLTSMKLKDGMVIDIGKLLNTEIQNKKSSGAEASAPHSEELSDEAAAANTKGKKPELTAIKRLQAYIVRHEGKNIGVLRIPSYSGNIVSELRWLEEVIKRLENSVDVLVLDVLSNSGGAVYLGTRLLSMLAGEESLQSIRANIRLNETLLHSWEPTYRSKNPETGEASNYAEDRIDQIKFEEWKTRFKSGQYWTGMVPYFANVTTSQGSGVIVPDPEARFTKPILVLNDIRSASGGDFIPAILQASGRGLVMGETSKGLGGPVYRSTDSMPGSQMFFRCTMAYCERADGLPIENIGVLADIHRPVSVKDMIEGFKDYSGDILAAAVALANGKKSTEIQTTVTELVGKRSKNEKLDKKLAPLRKEIENFQKSEIVTSMNDQFSLARAKELGQAYRELAQSLKEKGKDLSFEEWRGLTLPVPTSFLKQDQILSSLWKRDAVTYRLQQLEALKAWQKQPELLQFARDLRAALNEFPGDIRTANPCELVLFSLRQPVK